MIGGKKVLALITARGGSKRLPGKNIRPLGGKPLIAWSVEAAKGSAYIDRIVTSTDCPEIAAAAKAAGSDVPFMRPPELSGDFASSADVGIHALEFLADERYDIQVLLQPTSPLRTAADIDACLEQFVEKGASSAMTVCEPEKNPTVMFWREGDRLIPVTGIPLYELRNARSQEFRPAWEINGAVYVNDVKWFFERQSYYDDDTLPVEMPRERSANIDVELDFLLAEMLFAAGHGGAR